MDRYNEILKAVCQNEADRTTFGPLIRKAVLLEERMAYLESLPFIRVHPSDPYKQQSTAAHRQYKELLQQYANVIRILSRAHGAEDTEADSPLRKWARERAARNADK